MASRGGDDRKEDVMTAALTLIAAAAMMIFVIWVLGSHKIVNFWTAKMYWLAKAWRLLPFFDSEAYLLELHATGVSFLKAPSDVGFFDWASYVSACVRPLNLLVSLVLLVVVVRVLTRKRADLRRKFKPQHLAEYLSHTFTGTAPVLHLRKAISANSEPYWSRPVWPHEALQGKVNGKPMIVDGKLDRARVREHLQGIQLVRGKSGAREVKSINGRIDSATLGRQVVNLLTDRGQRPCFPDRFTNTGKVIYALLCAHAFGGKEGIADYAKARDQLNNSARGASHGFANLTVVQWLYDKYRLDPTAARLFAVHHWEATYLWALLFQAKRKGKAGHWEFLWLRPMNRSLFFALNTLGRLTPFAESAAAFSQYDYEVKVARDRRLPLMHTENGLVHVIFVERAIDGLSLEWDRWLEGTDPDDDDEWWNNDQVWKRMDVMNLAPPPAPEGLMEDTDFDRQMRQQTAAEESARAAEAKARASALDVDEDAWNLIGAASAANVKAGKTSGSF